MIVLNGQHTEIGPGETVATALGRLGLEVHARGVAVAVDGEVVPRAAGRRSRWRRTRASRC